LGAVLPLRADESLRSPKGTFTITQHQDGNWTTKLHFAKGAHPNVALTDDYPWPALFYVSPDERWILQIQKSGSGENISFLYRLEPNGRLWRMEQRFGELALAFLERARGIPLADLYHTGIEFEAWNPKRGLLQFTIRGSSVKRSGEGITMQMVYNLNEHRFRIP